MLLALPLAAHAALPMHPAPRPPAPSTLPPPLLVGAPATRLARPYSGNPIDVTNYHYDLNRTGWNQTETDLTPASVASGKFGLLKTLVVDGNVFAQPLLLSNFALPDGSVHNVLIIATSHNSVYAFDAQTYALLWHVTLGTAQDSDDVGCRDSVPEYGISSTPVIVRAANNVATIYVVAATEPSAMQFVSTLHALNAGTGADSMPPVVINPTATLSDGSTLTYNPQDQWTRAGLAANNGAIYVAVSSHCDNNGGNISGWLLGYTQNLALQSAFHSVQTHGGTELGSIWMTGFAPAIDASGNVFVVTGNGDFNHHANDWGQSALKLPASLGSVTSFFTPAKFAKLNPEDQDFGAGGIMLLPPIAGQKAPPMAVAMGKEGRLYLLNQNNLGGVRKGDAGALQSKNGHAGLWGGPAFYNGPAGPTIFIEANFDVLRAWSVTTNTHHPKLTQTISGSSGGGYGGSLPIVSSNGATANTGMVWLINRASEPFSIEGYDAEKLGAPIFKAQVSTWSNAAHGNPFLTPMQANGRLYAPGYKVVQVYGLVP